MNTTVELYLPFPGFVHPDVEAVHRHTLDWAVGLGLLEPGSLAYRRFEKARFAWLAARCWPELSRRALEIASDWIAFVFLIDDDLDDQHAGYDAGRLERLIGQTVRCASLLEGAPLHEDEPALGRAAADLRRRIVSGFPHYPADLFVERAVAYLRALLWEHSNRRVGHTPGLEEYTRMRVPAGGVLPCLALSLLDEVDAEALRTLTSDVPIRMLELAACHHVSWTNDLYSFEKEELEGNPANLVLLLEHETGLSRPAALREAVRQVDAQMHVFLALLSCRQPEREPVQQRYVRAMLSGMRGAADWHAEGHRSGLPAADGAQGNTALVVAA